MSPSSPKVLVTTYEGNPCALLVEGERIQEIRLGSPLETVGPGDLFLGRVERYVPGLNAVFVEIGLERTAFLPIREESSRRWKTGDRLLVSVARLSEGDKGHRLSLKRTFPGMFMVFEPGGSGLRLGARLKRELEQQGPVEEFRTWMKSELGNEGGMLLRTAALRASFEDLRAEADALLQQWRRAEKSAEQDKTPRLLHRVSNWLERSLRDWASSGQTEIWVEDGESAANIQRILEGFPGADPIVRVNEQARSLRRVFGIHKQLDSLRQRKLWLKSGGFLVIEKTEALTVIDVNSGRFSGGKKRGNVPLRVNKEAVAVSAEQIRLRGIEGITVIDLIEMPEPQDRIAIQEHAALHFRKDRARIRILPISEIGLLQISRQRTGNGLGSLGVLDCETCGGTGKRDRHGHLLEKIWDDSVAWATNAEGSANEVALRVRPHLLRAMDSAGFSEALESHIGIPVRIQEWKDAPAGKVYEFHHH